jgi:SSS family solute:Na+ symporter
MLNLDLILIDSLGFELTDNPYAFNETIRILIRTLTPLIIFILVAFLIPKESNQRVDRFFLKMKTQVADDPEKDLKQLEFNFAHPERVADIKLIPDSDWEFDRWDKEDWSGFLLSAGIVILLILFMIILTSIGA